MSSEHAATMLQMPLFRGFTLAGAQRLVELGEARGYACGEQLCNEGDPAASVLLILRGKLRLYVQREGEELVLAEHGPGTILGEIAVLCGLPRAVSVRAVEPSVVLYWGGEAFRALLLRDAFLSQRIFTATLRVLIEQEKALIESLALHRRTGRTCPTA